MKKNLFIAMLCTLLVSTQVVSSYAYDKTLDAKFKTQPLPYAYDALEPYIDKETMKLHHDKHYQTYVDKLNSTIIKHPELYFSSLEELLTNLDSLPSDVYLSVKNYAGGAYNHEFFFSNMSANDTKPTKQLLEAIERDFGSFDDFKTAFKKSSLDVFGSGWAWLVCDKDKKLSIITTANQDSPITINLKPIIGIDVWEHAYYLKYQNKRSDYIDNWFNVINWDKALENYNTI